MFILDNNQTKIFLESDIEEEVHIFLQGDPGFFNVRKYAENIE